MRINKKIGEALVESGLLTSEGLGIAIKEQEKTKERLGDIVIKMGLVSMDAMAPFLAGHFGFPYLRLRDVYKEIKPNIIKAVPENLAFRFSILPVGLEDSKLTLAMFDPLDTVAVDTISIKSGLKINRVVSSEEDIIQAIEYCYHQNDRLKDYIEDFIALEEHPEEKEDADQVRVEANDPPVVQYFNSLIIQAVNQNASDIHLRPKQDEVELAFRIDGVLYPLEPPPKRMVAAITTRIKILSNLDIAERRLPQDGRFKMKVAANEVDIRTSCFPTIYGESIVMRLLNVTSPLRGLAQIGFMPDCLQKYRAILRNSYGLVLVTGPTGSGKTTTLYASLNEIKSTEKNMITLEDPVEYRLPFLQQSQVNSAIGFNFAKGLRSILRQDPDIIMVGEIRDKETAEVAIQAALTGHLVLATLHTNDAASAVVRLIDMGVEPFLITSSLLGVLAQRLVRTICRDCRHEYSVEKDVVEKLLLKEGINKFYKGTGCPKCLNSGYRGRLGIFELLVPDEPMRHAVLARGSSGEIKNMAIAGGMMTLRDSGIEKLKAGITTPEEILRVTQMADEL
ncbi:MAG TPA: type II secretion system protein GspE [Candidatus Omnitrophica bacterium]|nr:type II secretion system protein GspE [Candidatus Omnitrophota bacterium]